MLPVQLRVVHIFRKLGKCDFTILVGKMLSGPVYQCLQVTVGLVVKQPYTSSNPHYITLNSSVHCILYLTDKLVSHTFLVQRVGPRGNAMFVLCLHGRPANGS